MLQEAVELLPGVESVRLKFGLLALLLSATTVSQASADPLDCTHLMAWTMAGVPQIKLVAAAKAHGLGFRLGPQTEKQLTSAGARNEFLIQLRRLTPVADSSCPARLSRATVLLHDKQYDDAADVVNRLLANDQHNGSLHFLLGFI